MIHECSLWLKITGTLLTGIGSILLAWRLKLIVKWVSLALNAHEISISMLSKAMSGDGQEFPVIEGTAKHLNDIETNLGTKLLVTGFASLGVGMVLNTLSIVLELL